jgi:hypothetical protein
MGHALGNNYGKMYSFQSKPVWLDLSFIVDSANGNGLGVRSVKGQGVKNVYMQTSATPATGNPMVNSTSAGYCLIELEYNYARNYGGYCDFVAPLTGGTLAINGSALTPGLPYTIVSVGHGAAGSATIAPVADVSGSLASKYFTLFDNYGNTFQIWFSVSGVGTAPIGVGGTLVQQSIHTNDSAATIGAALVLTIENLPSGIAGVNSFTATGTTTVTVTSTQNLPLSGPPADSSTAPTGFAFALVNYTTNLTDWQKVGVPAGIVPAIGVSFIATAAGYSTGGGSTGLVEAAGHAGVDHAETIGDPNQSIAPIPMGGSANTGGWILLQFMLNTTVTAPTDNTVISLGFLLEQGARVGGNQE